MSKLTNYLRTYRRRAGFSQDEVAFLLGGKSGSKASRYERLIHEPTLRAAMGYEVIFRTRLKELFAGIYDRVERDAIKRARALLRRVPVESMSETKAQALLAIAEPPVEDLRWEPVAKP